MWYKKWKFSRRVVTQQSLARLCECQVSGLSASAVKRTVQYFSVPKDEEWRVKMIQELVNNEVEVPGFLPSELKAIKDYLCTSWRPNLIYSINCTFIKVYVIKLVGMYFVTLWTNHKIRKFLLPNFSSLLCYLRMSHKKSFHHFKSKQRIKNLLLTKVGLFCKIF